MPDFTSTQELVSNFLQSYTTPVGNLHSDTYTSVNIPTIHAQKRDIVHVLEGSHSIRLSALDHALLDALCELSYLCGKTHGLQQVSSQPLPYKQTV